MKINCPTCGGRLEISESLGGSEVSCLVCHTAFVAPRPNKFAVQADLQDPRGEWAARFRKRFGLFILSAAVVILLAGVFLDEDLIYTVIALVLIATPFWVGYYLLTRLPMFIGTGGALAKGGDHSQDNRVEAASALIGSMGIVHFTLQPYGTVMISDSLWDAVSVSGEFLVQGTEVEIVGVEKALIPKLKVKRSQG